MPYEALFGPVKKQLTPTRRLAFVVARGELDGNAYDWDRRKWQERKR